LLSETFVVLISWSSEPSRGRCFLDFTAAHPQYNNRSPRNRRPGVRFSAGGATAFSLEKEN
jgi:hypothetical protein